MKVLKNYHVIKVSTNTNVCPNRVIIQSERFNDMVLIPFTNEPGAATPSIDSANIWLTDKGFNLVGRGEGKNCYYLFSDTFKPLKAIVTILIVCFLATACKKEKPQAPPKVQTVAQSANPETLTIVNR